MGVAPPGMPGCATEATWEVAGGTVSVPVAAGLGAPRAVGVGALSGTGVVGAPGLVTPPDAARAAVTWALCIILAICGFMPLWALFCIAAANAGFMWARWLAPAAAAEAAVVGLTVPEAAATAAAFCTAIWRWRISCICHACIMAGLFIICAARALFPCAFASCIIAAIAAGFAAPGVPTVVVAPAFMRLNRATCAFCWGVG
ncbi:hypothetical protein BC830DRAFT_1122710 [Chytriomyces sp. MP71]|nr:hypothetical protein BC830DRAFT_1122710 [Chytriomyces sp. MP71]